MSNETLHVPFDQLVDLVDGRLSAEAQQRAHAHLAACERCAAEVARLQRLIGLMRTDDSVDAPADLIARAVRVFHQRVAPLPQRLVAMMRFDSARQPQGIGIRSGFTGGRQLVFNAGDIDLDLRLSPVATGWVVSGQLLGSSQGGEVELHGPQGAARATLNQLCEFKLLPVEPGLYTLTLSLDGADLEITDLDIGG
ncbi:MAG: anti-sigma factor family protein [Roseiflexaceae bacterium]